jgi:hypothetical protein
MPFIVRSHVTLGYAIAALMLAGCERQPVVSSANHADREHDGTQRGDSTVVGVWVVGKDRQAKSMIEAAERDLGPLPPELRDGFRQTAREMVCEYDFRSNGVVTVLYRTNPESQATERGTWRFEGQRIIAEVHKEPRSNADASITRELWFENDYLVTEHPSTHVKWYLRRQ